MPFEWKKSQSQNPLITGPLVLEADALPLNHCLPDESDLLDSSKYNNIKLSIVTDKLLHVKNDLFFKEEYISSDVIPFLDSETLEL